MKTGRRYISQALQRWRDRSLVIDSTVRIFLVGIGLAMLFTLASMLFIRDHETKRLVAHVNELLITVESAVKIACYTSDATLANDVAKGLASNQLIAGIKITAGQQVLIDTKKPGAAFSGNYVLKRYITSPFNPDEPVGEIELTADNSFIQKQAVSYSIMSSIVLTLEVFAVALAVVMVMLRTVVKPIRQLSSRMSEIDIRSGEHVEPPEGNVHNEIGRLASDFNRLIDGMWETKQDLREETALNESRLHALLENSPNIVVRYDRNCRRVFVNSAYLRETGMTIDEVLGKHVDDVGAWKPSMSSKEYRQRLQQVMNSGTPDNILLEWSHPDGDLASQEMYVTAEYDTRGQVIGTLAIGRNVTQRKKPG